MTLANAFEPVLDAIQFSDFDHFDIQPFRQAISPAMLLDDQDNDADWDLTPNIAAIASQEAFSFARKANFDVLVTSCIVHSGDGIGEAASHHAHIETIIAHNVHRRLHVLDAQ